MQNRENVSDLSKIDRLARDNLPLCLPGHISTFEVVQRLIDYYTDEIDELVREKMMLQKNIAVLESQNAYFKRHSNFEGDEIFSIPT